MSNFNPKEKLSENFTRGELECPCCNVIPDAAFISKLQVLRHRVGVPLHISSGYRCGVHNKKIKGHRTSAHKVLQKNAAYGAVDVKTGRYNNKFRWLVINVAIKLGFNNIEVCDRHTHLGRVSHDHPGYNRIIWGVSK